MRVSDGGGPHGSQQTTLHRLLQVEEEAQARTQQAEERARRLLAEAEAQAQRLVTQARAQAEAEAQALIDAVRAQSQDADRDAQEASHAAVTRPDEQRVAEATALLVAWVTAEER